MLEWDCNENKGLDPQKITQGSGKYAWWKCKKGHSWEASIKNRSNGRSCPYCSNKKACEDNCLNTVNPELAKEWHPTKNGKLTPYNVFIILNK